MPVNTKLTQVLTPYILMLSLCLMSIFFTAQAEERTVKAVGTLSAIVNKNYIDAAVSKNQIMVAILAANPKAFKGGNINFMIRNAELRLPDVESIKSISKRDATKLLSQHYRLFRRGKTGNLPPPAFASSININQVETLVKEKQEQSEKLTSLEEERTALREMVKRLEDEKVQRDKDLQSLEEKIQSLQSSSSSLDSETADLKLKLANGDLSDAGVARLEELEARNQSLNAQLQSARSEMAESTRMEISLGRRMTDIQEENSLLAEALKKRGVSPTEVIQQTEMVNTPNQSLQNTTAINTTQTKQSASSDQHSSFIPNDLRWLLWFLPLLLLIALAWLIWKLLRGNKSKTVRRVQQPVSSPIDYSTPIDPELEIEQEPQLEVSIKMDVARAYIEAGDIPSAREMLAEVINEGNTSQQREAHLLLSEIGRGA